MSRRANLIVAATALAVAVLGVVLAVWLDAGGGYFGLGKAPLGETIFLAGVDTSGRAIPRSGGMMMVGGGCSTCHGVNGHGLSTPMFTSPNITYGNLTNPRGMLDTNGGRGPAYTDAALQRAVTQGVDPSGQQLTPIMPRWQLTQAEWAALLGHLKTLR
jgi:cytochrome c oxidase subunit 2